MQYGKRHLPADTKPDFTGRTLLITGANTGLGFEAAVKFVQLGAAKVILGVRTVSKGEDAKVRIEQITGRKNVLEVWHVDMLDYESIKNFASRVDKELERLDMAVLNAGVVMASFQESKYGWEKTLQVNVLSTSLLALLLLPKLRASKSDEFTPVLELISSGTHETLHKLRFDSTEPLAAYNKRSNFRFFDQYATSKLFLEYAHTGLAQLVTAPSGKPDVFVVSVCPGATKSELGRDSKGFLAKIGMVLMGLLFQRTTEQGARSYVSGLTLGEKGHGRFWQHDKIKE